MRHPACAGQFCVLRIRAQKTADDPRQGEPETEVQHERQHNRRNDDHIQQERAHARTLPSFFPAAHSLEPPAWQRRALHRYGESRG